MNARRLAIIILTLITAFIHLYLASVAFSQGDMQTTIMFSLNGLGYLALLAAYTLPIGFLQGRRSLVRWAFIALTAVTVLGWVVIGARTPLAYLDKLAELALLALLITDKGSM